MRGVRLSKVASSVRATCARRCSQRCRRLAKISAVDIADVCARVYGECVGLDAGRIGEEILHGTAGTGFAHDYRQACELAALSCKTEEAIDLFIAHRKIASCDPLQPYGYLNIALSLIFKIARELSGEEVNNVVASTVARWDLATRKRSDGLGVCASRMRRSSARLRT